MPAFLAPHKSTLHRIAAIALYRALLIQCRAVPLGIEQRDGLQNIVRNRFKQSQYVQSHRRLRVSFEAGYEAIDYLDDAIAGSEEAKGYIVALLERAPENVKQAPPPSKAFLRASKKKESATEEALDLQPKRSLFDRPIPLEELSGKRHVPVLFDANHIPVLRIKKPQPHSLSGFLNNRIKQRQARHDRRYRLYEELRIAKWEDEWDLLTADPTSKEKYVDVFEGTGIPDAMLRTKIVEKEQNGNWSDAVEAAITEVHVQLNEEREKNRLMAEKMQGVVDREKELFDKEKIDRKREKNLERRRRKQDRAKDPPKKYS